MRKKILAVLLVFVLSFTFGCTKDDQDSKISYDNQAMSQEKEKQKVHDEIKSEKEAISPKNKENKAGDSKDENSVTTYAIYFEESNPIVFSDEVKIEDLKNYVKSKKISLEQVDLLSINTKEGKILNLSILDSITVDGKYVGLVDNSEAEFSVGDKFFRLRISPDEMDDLESTKENQLLGLNIRKSENASNLVLASFTKR